MDAKDHDGDGFAFSLGDCNDCDPDVNPGAYDILGDGIDQDCNGVVDDEPTGCDSNLLLTSTDPMDAARAMGLCRQTTESAQGTERTWGVISAAFVAPDGTDDCAIVANDGGVSSCAAGPSWSVGHGNLAAFGDILPRDGKAMLAISSGTARPPGDPGYQDVLGLDKMYTTGAPAPYPKMITACTGGILPGQAHDGIALKVVIRVPTNMRSFSFDETVFLYDFPQFVCSIYNDVFVVMMTPQVPGLADGNITFDGQGAPVTVDSTSLLRVCDPQSVGGLTFPCARGASTLAGTGFGVDTTTMGDRGATGWLVVSAPVATEKGKDITLLFAIWDSSDGVLDSTALIDHFIWSAGSASTSTTPAP